MISNLSKNDTIIAPTTAPGMGAIAVIRISGPEAIQKTNVQFKKIKSDKSLLEQASHTVHFVKIYDNDKLIDEVLVTLFKGPNSYTGEDTI
jgi:tRNA modification GTPase